MATKQEVEAALELLRKNSENVYAFDDLEIIECKRCNKVVVQDEESEGMCLKCWGKTESEKTNIQNKIVTMLTKKVSKIIKFSKTKNSERITLTYRPGGFNGDCTITSKFELDQQNVVVGIDTDSSNLPTKHLCFKNRFCLANPNVHEEVNEWLIAKFYKIEMSIRAQAFVPKNLTYKKYIELGGKDKNLAKLAVLVGEKLE
jgi:uncharacterized protein YajQ (UPF0234 family)